MTDEHQDWRTADPSNELNDPKNPPQSVLRPEARRAALMSYLGPVVVLFAIVGIALIYWSNRGPVLPDERDERSAVGTTGSATAGGTDPRPHFGKTSDEIEYRGSDERQPDASRKVDPAATLTRLDTVRSIGTAGRPVEIDSAEVTSVDKDVLWVTGDGARVAVLAPEGAKALKAGAHVRITGTTALDRRGDIGIRASRVEEKER
jgi:hypothetical protein